MTQTEIKLSEFITEHGIEMQVERVKRNPNMMDMMDGASHYLCNFRRHWGDGAYCLEEMDVTFSMGSAHTEPPTVEDVLDCLASDASGYMNAGFDFEEWASEYGYDTDSRKAYHTFETVEEQADQLRKFMGDEYETLLWSVERL